MANTSIRTYQSKRKQPTQNQHIEHLIGISAMSPSHAETRSLHREPHSAGSGCKTKQFTHPPKTTQTDNEKSRTRKSHTHTCLSLPLYLPIRSVVAGVENFGKERRLTLMIVLVREKNCKFAQISYSPSPRRGTAFHKKASCIHVGRTGMEIPYIPIHRSNSIIMNPERRIFHRISSMRRIQSFFFLSSS